MERPVGLGVKYAAGKPGIFKQIAVPSLPSPCPITFLVGVRQGLKILISTEFSDDADAEPYL